MSWKCHDTEVIVLKTTLIYPGWWWVQLIALKEGTVIWVQVACIWPSAVTLRPAGLISSQVQLCRIWIIPCKAIAHSSPLQPQRMVKGGVYHCTNVQSLLLCNARLLSQRKKHWEGRAGGAVLLSIWQMHLLCANPPGPSTGESLVLPPLQGAWLSLGRLRDLARDCHWQHCWRTAQGCDQGRGTWPRDSNTVITNPSAMDKPSPPSLLATVFSLAGPQKFFLWWKGSQFPPAIVGDHISKSGQASHPKRWTAWDKQGSLCGSVLSYLIHSPWLLTRWAITAPLELFSVLVPVPYPWIIDMMEHNGSLRALHIFSCQIEYREMFRGRNSLIVVLLLCVFVEPL